MHDPVVNGNLVERMSIKENGKVGIGTTSPQYSLDVNGTGRISNIYFNVGAAKYWGHTFVLQHVQDPKTEIEIIHSNLKDNGYLILVNEDKRYVPSDVDKNRFIIWNDDGFDIFDELNKKFTLVNSIPYMNSNADIIIYKKWHLIIH